MRLWIDLNTFLSVLRDGEEYSCLVMEIRHRKGMYPAIHSELEDSTDIICTTKSGYNSQTFSSLEQVFKYHETLLFEWDTQFPPEDIKDNEEMYPIDEW